MRYVIIGFSAAGLAAVRAIREVDQQGEIIVITDEHYPVYSRCLLTYFLSGRIKNDDMFIADTDEIQQLRIVLKLGHKVMSIDTITKEVILSNEERVYFDKLLIAAGASAVQLNNPDKFMGIHCLRNYDDANTIAKELVHVKKAVVLGDGLVALTAALALKVKGLDVAIVGISDYVLAQFLDKKAAELAHQELVNQGLSVYLNATVNKCEADKNGRIKRVQLPDERWLDTDLVIAAIGVRPNIEFLDKASISVGRGVLVNDYMETDVPGIFAAGDIAQTTNVLTGKREMMALWPLAVEEGRIAGLNMTGISVRYKGALAMNSVSIGSLSIIAAGNTGNIGDGLEFHEYLNDAKREYKRLVFRNNKLVGYTLVGRTEKAGILSALIREEVDVSTVKEELFAGQINYPKMSVMNI